MRYYTHMQSRYQFVLCELKKMELTIQNVSCESANTNADVKAVREQLERLVCIICVVDFIITFFDVTATISIATTTKIVVYMVMHRYFIVDSQQNFIHWHITIFLVANFKQTHYFGHYTILLLLSAFIYYTNFTTPFSFVIMVNFIFVIYFEYFLLKCFMMRLHYLQLLRYIIFVYC